MLSKISVYESMMDKIDSGLHESEYSWCTRSTATPHSSGTSSENRFHLSISFLSLPWAVHSIAALDVPYDPVADS